jgi:hypothetical protein
MLLVSAATYAPTNTRWARVVDRCLFSFIWYVIHKEGLCPSSGDINRLIMGSVQCVFHHDRIKIRQLFLRPVACLSSTLLRNVVGINHCEYTRDGLTCLPNHGDYKFWPPIRWSIFANVAQLPWSRAERTDRVAIELLKLWSFADVFK